VKRFLQATFIHHDRPVFVCIGPYASHYNGWLQISLWVQKESSRLQHAHDNRNALLDSLLLLNIPPTVVKTVFFLTLAKLCLILGIIRGNTHFWSSEQVPLLCLRKVRWDPVLISVDYFGKSVCSFISFP
jgi:hypothetical protein